MLNNTGEEVKETREMADAFFRLLGNKLNLKNLEKEKNIDPAAEEQASGY